MYLPLLQNVHDRVCPDPDTLTEGQKRNRRYADDTEMYDVLKRYAECGPMYKGHSAAESAAWNEGLIEVAPLTDRQLIMKSKGYKLNHRFVITNKGRAYLFWRDHMRRVPPCTRADLRQYERHFATATRWTAALVAAQRHAAEAEAAREAFEDHNDNRALMAGMG